MREARVILDLLLERLRETGCYETHPIPEAPLLCATLRLADAEVVLYADEEEGQLKRVLSFLLQHGASTAVHLNAWTRPGGALTPEQLVASLWASFWAHELENRTEGRTQWMHGAELPQGPKRGVRPVVVAMEDVLALFGE